MQNQSSGPIMPPKMKDVEIYFLQKGMTEKDARLFYQFYEAKKWKNDRGDFLKGWKGVAWNWISEILLEKPWLFNRYVH